MKNLRHSVVDLKRRELKSRVLNCVYHARQATLSWLAKEVNLSIPTVTEIVEELIREKWLESPGMKEDFSAGRRARVFTMRKDFHYLLIYEINQTGKRISVMNLAGEILAEVCKEEPLVNEIQTVTHLIRTGEEILNGTRISKEKLAGIGVSLQGLVNPYRKEPVSYLNFPANPLVNTLSEHFGVPIVIENDLKAMAEGERCFGQLKDVAYGAVVNADYGIGVGLVTDNQVYRGTSGFSGELGHIPSGHSDKMCYCGKRGCLETIVSVPYLLERAREMYEKGNLILRKKVGKNIQALSVGHLIDAAEEGDEEVIDLFYATGHELGKGIAVLVHLLNPSCIVISGSLSRAGRFILHPVEEALNKYCISKIRKDVSVVLTGLGDNACRYGMQSILAHFLLGKNIKSENK